MKLSLGDQPVRIYSQEDLDKMLIHFFVVLFVRINNQGSLVDFSLLLGTLFVNS